jgi:hypothetical protein
MKNNQPAGREGGWALPYNRSMASIGFNQDEFMAQLDQEGEEAVRHNLNLGLYSTVNGKRQLVEAWLKRKDQTRQSERERREAVHREEQSILTERSVVASERQAEATERATRIAVGALVISFSALLVSMGAMVVSR